MRTLKIWLASAVCVMTVAPANATYVDGADAADPFLPVLEARFRSFRPTGGQEIYVGVGDVGRAQNRSALDVPWTVGSHPVVFVYDPAADLLRAAATVQGQTYGVEFGGVAARVASNGSGWNVGDLNALRITVMNRDGSAASPAEVRFTEVQLNGRALVDFGGVGNQGHWWSGLDLGRGFELTANLELGGAFGWQQEASKVSLEVGHVGGAYTPVPEGLPVWSGVPLLMAALWGVRRRVARG